MGSLLIYDEANWIEELSYLLVVDIADCEGMLICPNPYDYLDSQTH